MTGTEVEKRISIHSSDIVKLTILSGTRSMRLGRSSLYLALISATYLSQAQHREISGELDGVLFDILHPEKWKGDLLIYNHGLIFEHLPPSTYLEPSREPFTTLLDNGWLLAASSYRRNGLIVGDAVDDVLQLIEHLRERFGRPKNTFFIGESMGGAITLRLLEDHPGRFQGALILGRGLFTVDPASPYTYRYQPEAPVLFLCNVSEIDQAREYVAKAADHGETLALWEIKREGHVNINRAEYLAALHNLFLWAEGNEITFRRNATINLEEETSTAHFADGGAYGRVRRIDPTFGNLSTTFVSTDWARLGVAIGQIFDVNINGNLYQASLVSTYADVPRGYWLAFRSADGYFTIAINFDSAAQRAGVSSPGEPIFISNPQRRLDPRSRDEPINKE